jgi:hypothetical protein
MMIINMAQSVQRSCLASVSPIKRPMSKGCRRTAKKSARDNEPNEKKERLLQKTLYPLFNIHFLCDEYLIN